MANSVQAVIETGGKQYLVAAGDKITIEKLELAEGSTISFDKVLFVGSGSSVKIGQPFVTGAIVTGEVMTQQRGEKLTVFKYRAKSRYRRKTGHRQSETVVSIRSIS